jgi:LPXTG-motif cell wall-anchored protein
VTGTFTLIGPRVGGVLAATGGNETWTLLGGGVLVLAAVGMVAVRRRARRGGATA